MKRMRMSTRRCYLIVCLFTTLLIANYLFHLKDTVGISVKGNAKKSQVHANDTSEHKNEPTIFEQSQTDSKLLEFESNSSYTFTRIVPEISTESLREIISNIIYRSPIKPDNKIQNKLVPFSVADITGNRENLNKLNYEELKERRNRGYLDNIPLRYLVEQTNFLRTPKSPCNSSARMIVLVSSACRNEQRRQAIRNTWGSNSVRLNVPVLFFVGQCPNATRELEIFHDVVEVDFVESYYNITLKSLARLRWYNEQCSSPDLVVIVDDDVMVNVDLMVKYLPRPLGYSAICRMHRRAVPVRENTHKWYVPKWVERNSVYPDYCFGSSYVINSSAIAELYQASLELTYSSIEDVIFTGYAAEMIGLARINDDRFLVVGNDIEMLCDEKGILATHGYDAEQMKSYWSKKKQKCNL